MSGQEISRKYIWIFMAPLMFLFALLILIFVIPVIDTTDIFSGFNFTGISGGIVQILPELGIGLGIAMLTLVFAIISRRRR